MNTTSKNSFDAEENAAVPLPLLAGRGVIGGILMGLANLVPGISGGTMLLAAGVYPRFINAIAEVSTLRLKKASLVLLGSVVVAAAIAILLCAGTIKGLVVDHRWAMYSIFIGLTLGGVPVVWKMAKPATGSMWAGAVAGFVAMALLAWMQTSGAGTGGAGAGSPMMMFLAGVAGASAMILPGVSGGYLLLVLGQYVPILSGIDQFKEALKGGDWAVVIDVGLKVGLPVGLGVVLGIVVVSNLLRWLLRRAPKATLGVLLGLLLGAVVGLWPFQQGVAPSEGAMVKGQIVTAETLAELDPDDYPTEFFCPSGNQIAGSCGLILFGLCTTTLVSWFGRSKE